MALESMDGLFTASRVAVVTDFVVEMVMPPDVCAKVSHWLSLNGYEAREMDRSCITGRRVVLVHVSDRKRTGPVPPMRPSPTIVEKPLPPWWKFLLGRSS